MMKDMPSYFGSMVFNETVMQTRLPPDIYNALQETITQGTPLDLDIADAVAKAMKEWALEKGASHFAHWFQPLTGATAEKHEGFISPGKDGRIIMEFSGQELLRGNQTLPVFPRVDCGPPVRPGDIPFGIPLPTPLLKTAPCIYPLPFAPLTERL